MMRSWRSQVVDWDNAAFPDNAASVMTSSGSQLWVSKTRPLVPQRTRVISTWVRTTAEAQIQWLIRGKTNIIPIFANQDRVEDQQLERMIQAGIGIFRLNYGAFLAAKEVMLLCSK
ncbi:MAG: hypothetical protein IIC60_02380 [Proteobacteria bacterium]|nr:hypothetical protein [Pseudomonadota bacterium]